MGESFMWIFALLILLFGGNFGGFFGGNRGPAPDQVTQAELQAGLNNVQVQNQLQQLGIAVEGTKYDTAIQVNQLGAQIANQNNANQINVIQGFNQLSSKLDNLGYQMEQCCCQIKTQLLQDKYEQAQAKVVALQNQVDNRDQTQTILGSLGRFVAWAGSGTQAVAAATT